MPRLPHSLLHAAHRQHFLLPLLLRERRDLPSAKNELRWLAEDAFGVTGHGNIKHGTQRPINLSRLVSRGPDSWRRLHRNVLRRSRGEPLQYILGTAPFGELEIRCRRGVLIPRWETEGYTEKLAGVLKESPIGKTDIEQQGERDGGGKGLRILDLCTGSGCIPLLLHSLLRPATNGQLEVLGVDVSTTALELATENLKHNIGLGRLHVSAVEEISFRYLDVLALAEDLDRPNLTEKQKQDILGRHLPRSSFDLAQASKFDVVVSNPPYISPRQYAPGGPTARSVRNFEPKTALVPPRPTSLDDGDEFYPAILRIASAVGAKCVVMEVGDREQATRVAHLAGDFSAMTGEARIEIWDDDGGVRVIDGDRTVGESRRELEGNPLHDRAVVVWQGGWARV